jgi:hypothetical protein
MTEGKPLKVVSYLEVLVILGLHPPDYSAIQQESLNEGLVGDMVYG